MQQWEYLCVQLRGNRYFDEHNQWADLSILGTQGWELVSVIVVPDANAWHSEGAYMKPGGHTVTGYFKRAKP